MSPVYRVVVTDPAANDLDEIVAYHIDTLSAPRAAADLLDGFDALLSELEETPDMYLKVRNPKLAMAGYRWAPLANSYAAFFIVDEDEKQVTIDRILYRPRHWKSVLGL